MRSGRARPAPRGPGLRPCLGAAGLPPSLSSLRRGAGLGAAGPAPRGAAPQRPGGRPRLGRRLGLAFPSPAARARSAPSCPGPLPPPSGVGPAPPPLPRDFPPPRTESAFLLSFLPYGARLRCPLPGSASLPRDFPHSGPGSRFPVSFLSRGQAAAAGSRGGGGPPNLPFPAAASRNQEARAGGKFSFRKYKASPGFSRSVTAVSGRVSPLAQVRGKHGYAYGGRVAGSHLPL